MATVRAAAPEDAPAWLEMRQFLWPESSEAEHRAEIARYFSGDFPRGPWRVLLAEEEEQILGFAEFSLRPYAEGCASSPVAYLEGWYVVPGARRRGIGRRLVEAGEAWSRDQGCTELASDADAENTTSIVAHQAVSFQDAGLVRCFRKRL